MRHAVVLLLAVSLSGFPATGEMLTPPPGLRSGAVASAPPATPAQLPPEIMVDRHLVRVDRLLAADDLEAALEAMNEVIALQEEHDLELGNDFPFRYARVAFAAGRTETAIASLNEYLVAAGRQGEFYREALQLLDSAEVRLAREEVQRRRAEAERRRAARWPPGHVFRECETCPEMVVLPGSRLALGRYEVTLGEYRAFAAATGGGAGGGCQAFDDGDHSWQNPSFPQTDRHPVTCMNLDDARAYVSWLSRTSGIAYRLPTWAELVRAADGSRPGCYSDRTGRDGTCPVGAYGSSVLEGGRHVAATGEVYHDLGVLRRHRNSGSPRPDAGRVQPATGATEAAQDDSGGAASACRNIRVAAVRVVSVLRLGSRRRRGAVVDVDSASRFPGRHSHRHR